MRILILSNNSGGLYRFRIDLLKSLMNQGHEVIASTPFDDYVEELNETGVRLIETLIDRRGMNLLKDFKLLFIYWRMIRLKELDLIITYTIKPNIYGSLVSKVLKKRYVINITGLGSIFERKGITQIVISVLYRFVCSSAHTVFFENEGNADLFIQKRLVNRSKVCVLHGAGVDIDLFPYTEYPNEDDGFHFLFVGRIMKEKGIEELLAAMQRLHQEHPNVVLDVIGEFAEEKYRQVVEKFEKEGVLIYHGYQKEIQPFYAKAHCFVLPSYHEGMANTLLEAAAMGRPIITSKIHGCIEAVEGNNGLFIVPQNTDSVYKAMIQMLEMNSNERIEMGKRGHSLMVENFSKNSVVEETIHTFYSNRR
ncbi:galacturonosyl transferase [Clostridia bacterium]|nr:galacturonosyl transferase [Clostridia bacterium]